MTLSGLLPATTKLFQTKTQLGLDPGRGHCPAPEQMAAGPGRCPLPSGSSALCRQPWATPLKGPALRAGWRRLGGAEGKWRRPRPGAGPGGGGLTCPPTAELCRPWVAVCLSAAVQQREEPLDPGLASGTLSPPHSFSYSRR